MKSIRAISLIFLSALLSSPAIAEGERYYIYPEIGQIQLREHCEQARSQGATSCDEKEAVFGLVGGVNVHDNFSLEGGVHYGTGFDAILASSREESDFTSLSFGGRMWYPIFDDNMFFTGRLGIHSWQLNTDVSGGASSDQDGVSPYFGAGIGISRYDRISVLLEYSRYTADNDADMLTFGAKLDL